MPRLCHAGTVRVGDCQGMLAKSSYGVGVGVVVVRDEDGMV